MFIYIRGFMLFMIHIILLAAGESRRFGGNKLLSEFMGKPLYRHVFDKLTELIKKRSDLDLCVVTQYEEIRKQVCAAGIPVIWNDHSYEGITSSLKLGIACVGEVMERDYYCFFVADQPHMKIDTMDRFFDRFLQSGFSLGCIRYEGHKGNPTIFHVKYREELLALTGDTGGKQVFSRHPEDCFYLDADSQIELVDYDERW